MCNNKDLTNNTNNNRGRAAWARGFIPLFAMLAMGLGRVDGFDQDEAADEGEE